MVAYVRTLAPAQFPELQAKSDVPLETLAARLTGLSRVGARTAIALAMGNDRRITAAWLGSIKKDLIERECQGLLDFIESPFTLDNVAGHDAVKAWLREDAELLKRGALQALPMGYLIAGRIGTGKTFLVQCWAGELGIPCVVFKNFRDRWVGATESNLEKIFAILRALGQVVVFVDEADQAAGKREGGDGDSGLSGPRLLDAGQGDVRHAQPRPHPLGVRHLAARTCSRWTSSARAGSTSTSRSSRRKRRRSARRCSGAIAKKLKFPLTAEDLPPFTDDVTARGERARRRARRALRTDELRPSREAAPRGLLAEVIKEVRPSPHTRKLEYMDLVAVKECTDARFLPRFRDLTPEELETRIDALSGS